MAPRDSDHARMYQRNYARSAKRKAVRRRYNQSERGKATNNAQSRRWRKANPDKLKKSYRKHDLKRHYGMTPMEWDAMFAVQGCACAVCKATTPGRKTGHWSTDHDHTTGKVRGILCNGCNMALGQAKDDPLRLRLLAEYLEERKDTSHASN